MEIGCGFSFKNQASLVLQGCDGKRPVVCFWLVVWLEKLKILLGAENNTATQIDKRQNFWERRLSLGSVIQGTTAGEVSSKLEPSGSSYGKLGGFAMFPRVPVDSSCLRGTGTVLSFGYLALRWWVLVHSGPECENPIEGHGGVDLTDCSR